MTIRDFCGLKIPCGGGAVGFNPGIAQTAPPSLRFGRSHIPLEWSPDDAPGIKIPVCVLASKDEDPDRIKAFWGSADRKEARRDFRGPQVHGWIGAR